MSYEYGGLNQRMYGRILLEHMRDMAMDERKTYLGELCDHLRGRMQRIGRARQLYYKQWLARDMNKYSAMALAVCQRLLAGLHPHPWVVYAEGRRGGLVGGGGINQRAPCRSLH